MIAHTPGPWHWDSDPIKDDPYSRVRYRVVAKGRTITQCYYPSGDCRQAEADTRLVTTAPELLEVLEEVLDALRIHAPGTPLNNHRFDALGIKCHAVIARAKAGAA